MQCCGSERPSCNCDDRPYAGRAGGGREGGCIIRWLTILRQAARVVTNCHAGVIQLGQASASPDLPIPCRPAASLLGGHPPPPSPPDHNHSQSACGLPNTRCQHLLYRICFFLICELLHLGGRRPTGNGGLGGRMPRGFGEADAPQRAHT